MEEDDIEMKSGEINEILSEPPHVIVRIGTAWISAIILFVFICSFFIYYPDVIKAEVLVTIDSLSAPRLPHRKQLVGKAMLSAFDIGKVRIGQTVTVKLRQYLDNKDGKITGRVQKITQNSNKHDESVVIISLPQEFTAILNHRINLFGDLSGTAKIIVKDKSIGERIISPFVSVLKKNKK